MFVWLKLLQFELRDSKRSVRIVKSRNQEIICVIKSGIVLPIWHKDRTFFTLKIFN
jgi:hypothetical protein